MLRKLPILTFHSIEDTGSVISIKPSRFENILHSLRKHQFQTLLLSDVVEWLTDKRSLSNHSVVITFDDGFASVYEYALPLLQKFEYQATLFLTTDFCGKNNTWPSQVTGVPTLPILSWEQVKTLAQSGFEIAAHSRTHPFLTRLRVDNVIQELVGSKEKIEDRLGSSVRFFAYPYGDCNKRVCELTGEYFDAACSTSLGFATEKSDMLQLERIDSYYFSRRLSNLVFKTPLFSPYLQVRRLMRCLRSARQSI